MALIADIMPLLAGGLAVLLFVAEGALHLSVFFEIEERRTADQTFILHGISTPLHLYFLRKSISFSLRFLNPLFLAFLPFFRHKWQGKISLEI